ncbi:MAG TPA: tetratricopeptide repeat protein, partial [bacterium]|nr:tetratricopeptide repeat protein [bacterium]
MKGAIISTAVLLLALLPLKRLRAGPSGEVAEGNRLYREGNYQEALSRYGAAAQALPDAPQIFYNQANTHYRMRDFKTADSLYKKIAGKDEGSLGAWAWYNLGNSLMGQEKYREALEAYRHSMRLAPGDEDAKYNYEIALRRQQQQQQEQQQQQQEQGQQQQQQQ